MPSSNRGYARGRVATPRQNRTKGSEEGEYASRFCMMEGFVGRAEKAHVRVQWHGQRNIQCATAASQSINESKNLPSLSNAKVAVSSCVS